MKDALLIAENAETVRSFTSMLSPDCKVHSVASEEEGIEALKKGYDDIAVMLIELGLVRKSGFGFSDCVQAYSSLSPVPIIAVSDGLPSDEDMDCLEHGFLT